MYFKFINQDNVGRSFKQNIIVNKWEQFSVIPCINVIGGATADPALHLEPAIISEVY